MFPSLVQRSAAALAALGLFACQAPTDPTLPIGASLNQGNGVVASVTGSIHHERTGGLYRSTTINAIKRADGTVIGKVESHAHALQAHLHATVNCLRVVGNRAYLSGVIQSYKPGTSGLPDVRGWAYVWVVQDDGQGAGIDQVHGSFAHPTFFGTPGDPQLCESGWLATGGVGPQGPFPGLDWFLQNMPFTTIRGNIQVRGG